MPFYAWQCITLQLKHRYVDLVIKNEKSLELFMRFLVFTLNTEDGKKDTAEPTVKKAYYSELIRQHKKLKEQVMSKTSMKQTDLLLSKTAKR